MNKKTRGRSMSSRMRSGLMAVAFLSAFVMSGVATVSAQQTNRVANGYRVSPVRSELTIEKGKKQTVTITVENPTDLPTTARALVNDFVASEDESGSPRLILDENVAAPKNSFKKLVGSIADTQLQPKQKKDVQVTINVPESANSGGYYGAIRFAPADTGDISNVGLTASVGTIVLVNVPGNLVEKTSLLQLSAAQNGTAKSFITKGDIQVLTRLKNEGDIHVKPFGKVEIKNMFGKEVATYELNNAEPRANILPGSSRKFVENVNNKKWFGRYTISANIGYSQGSGNIITAKSSFWYLPVWSLWVLAAIIVAIVIGVYLLVRRFGSRAGHHSRR